MIVLAKDVKIFNLLPKTWNPSYVRPTKMKIMKNHLSIVTVFTIINKIDSTRLPGSTLKVTADKTHRMPEPKLKVYQILFIIQYSCPWATVIIEFLFFLDGILLSSLFNPISDYNQW